MQAPDLAYVPDYGARATLNKSARLGLLFAFAMLLVSRVWQAVWYGRFLGEEGTIFFAYAWHRPAWEALWRSFGGYLNIGANATMLAAARMVREGYISLENAPHFTMFVALLFQLLPAVILLTGNGRWLSSRWAVVASLLVLALCPISEEVWINTMHIQFHLVLCCGLILALGVPYSGAGRLGYWLILFLAPLCGPGAIVLLPLFALRSLIERDWARVQQTIVLSVGSLIQLLVFFTPSPLRGDFLDPMTLATVLFVRLGALPFGGIIISEQVGHIVDNAYVSGGIVWWIIIAISLLYCGFLAILALRHLRGEIGWLIAAALLVAAASFGGGMLISPHSAWFNVASGERYNFVPLALLGLALVAFATSGEKQYRRMPQRLCVLVLVLAAVSYPYPMEDMTQGPRWRDEVAMWHRDHDYQLVTWPTHWTVDLSDQHRPCHPINSRVAARVDPSYCESTWVAHIKWLTAEIEKHRPSATKP